MTAIPPSKALGLDLGGAEGRGDSASLRGAEVIARWAMALAAAAIVAGVSIRTIASCMTAGDIEHTSGTWMTMAADARDGILYRPIVSNLGYGGTRYVPFYALVQAGLLKMGMGYVGSGCVIGIVSMGMILGACWILMRRLGATPWIASCCTCYILGATGVCNTIAANKADVLAAALSFWGVVAVTGIRRDGGAIAWRAVVLAASCFTLAVATKITCIFGLAAGTIWLWLQGQRRPAIVMVLIWIGGIIAAAMATQWISGGRALTVFRACAAGGGGIRELVRGPLMFLANGLGYDKTAINLWALAVVVLLGSGRRQWATLPAILLIISIFGTMAIFGTPGINVNHLIDLYAAALIFLAVQWQRAPARHVFAIFVCAVIGYKSFQCVKQANAMWRDPARGEMNAALVNADASPGAGPLLSENPVMPLWDGERPYLLDSFMLRVMNQNKPEVCDKFWDDLGHQRFRAVILTHPPTWHRMYTENNFGPGFMESLKKHYELKSSHGDFYVFWPKRD